MIVNIFTAQFGEVTKGVLVKKTLQGYRVTTGRHGNESVVAKEKQFSGWHTKETKIYHQQRAFESEVEAKGFAGRQISAMKNYHIDEIERLNELRDKVKG